jgi:hypothetical protein
MDDFDSASKQCEEPSCLPVAFLLHRDSHDWKPDHVKTDHMEKKGRGKRSTRLSVCLCLLVSAME